jgi:hypothetical protein
MDLMVRIPNGGAPDRSRSLNWEPTVRWCRTAAVLGSAIPRCQVGGLKVVNESVSTAHPFDPDAKFKHVLV